MDIKALRRQNVSDLIQATPYNGNQAAFAREIGVKPPQLSRWMSTTAKDLRGIDEESARKIESTLGLARLYLDTDHKVQPIATATVTPRIRLSEAGLSDAAAKIVRMVRELDLAGKLPANTAQAITLLLKQLHDQPALAIAADPGVSARDYTLTAQSTMNTNRIPAGKDKGKPIKGVAK